MHELADEPALWEVVGREAEWQHALTDEAGWDSMLEDVRTQRLWPALENDTGNSPSKAAQLGISRASSRL